MWDHSACLRSCLGLCGERSSFGGAGGGAGDMDNYSVSLIGLEGYGGFGFQLPGFPKTYGGPSDDLI